MDNQRLSAVEEDPILEEETQAPHPESNSVQVPLTAASNKSEYVDKPTSENEDVDKPIQESEHIEKLIPENENVDEPIQESEDVGKPILDSEQNTHKVESGAPEEPKILVHQSSTISFKKSSVTIEEVPSIKNATDIKSEPLSLHESNIEVSKNRERLDHLTELERYRRKIARKKIDEQNIENEKQMDKEESFEIKKEERKRKRTLSKQVSVDDPEFLSDIKSIISRPTQAEILEEYTDESSSSESEINLSSKKTVVSFKEHFLEYFESLPYLSDISSESTSEVQFFRKTDHSLHSHSQEDIGHFVDPLTGESISSMSSSSEIEEEMDVEVKEETVSEESSNWDLELVEDEPPQVVVEEDMNETYEAFVTLQESRIFIEPCDVDLASKAIELEHQKIAKELLRDLFDELVERAEYIDPNILLEKNLSKKKLFEEMKTVLRSYILEKQWNTSLNSKVAEYYKRGKSMRAISELPNNILHKEIDRYKIALAELDHFRKVAAATKNKYAVLLSSVLMDLQYIQNITLSAEANIAKQMVTHLVRKDSVFLMHAVEKEIRKMNALRNQVSDTRLVLITRKHVLARLSEKILKFESIAEDLDMNRFISIQNEVQNLDNKREEKTCEWKKAHNVLESIIQRRAHIHERSSTLELSLVQVKENYRCKELRQRNLREQISSLRFESAKLREQIKSLIEQAGLLAHPTLMFDFDATKDYVDKKRTLVENLRKKMQIISQRIPSANELLTSILQQSIENTIKNIQE